MPLKSGTIDFKMPYSKAYLGSTLIYQEATGEEVAFTSCLFPETWTAVTGDTVYSSTNDYGIWTISSNGRYSNNYNISYAFDGSTSSGWRNASGGGKEGEIIINCPVLIKPTTIYVKSSSLYNSNCTLQGYNPTTESWEDLFRFNKNGEITEVITTSNYYSKFRIYGTNMSNTSTMSIDEFQITEGYYKPREDTVFTTCLFPTSWTQVTKGTEYEATNDYGDWRITANNYSSSYYVSKAFDINKNTYWQNDEGTSKTGEVTIECPVLIQPIKVSITFRYFYSNGGGVLQGYNSITGSWEDLLSISEPDDGFSHTITETITTSSYYNKFRICSANHSILNKKMEVYEFQITEGYYK
jgi:hypothetical protein